MSRNIRAADASLDDLRQEFGLQRVEQPDFFPEWQSDLTELSEEDKHESCSEIKCHRMNSVSGIASTLKRTKF